MEAEKNGFVEIPHVKVPAVQIVLLRQGESGAEVFLGKRSAGGFLDQWSFPGGKIDPGETPEKAARRELLEEAGVLIGADNITFLRRTNSPTTRIKNGQEVVYDYALDVFLASGQQLTPYNASPEEHSEMKWISIGDALAMHQDAVDHEISLGVARPMDKIPGALSPKTHETLQYLLQGQ